MVAYLQSHQLPTVVMPKMLWSLLSLNDLFLQSKEGILCTIARQHRHVY